MIEPTQKKGGDDVVRNEINPIERRGKSLRV